MEIQLNAKTIAWNKYGVVKAVKAACVDPLAKCALAVEVTAKRMLSQGGKKIATAQFGDKRARFIFESGPPGQPPRLRSGNLRNSIKSAKTDLGTWIVGPTASAWYGRVQEFGALIKVTPKMRGFLYKEFGWRVGKDAIYIPPRPFMRPAAQIAQQNFPQFFSNLPLRGPEA
jgi:hypothetical protein